MLCKLDWWLQWFCCFKPRIQNCCELITSFSTKHTEQMDRDKLIALILYAFLYLAIAWIQTKQQHKKESTSFVKSKTKHSTKTAIPKKFKPSDHDAWRHYVDATTVSLFNTGYLTSKQRGCKSTDCLRSKLFQTTHIKAWEVHQAMFTTTPTERKAMRSTRIHVINSSHIF